MPIQGVAFDMFNTLVDLEPLRDRIAAHAPDSTNTVFDGFFPRLVSWSWYATASGEYRPFPEIAALALQASAVAAGCELDSHGVRAVVAAMNDLPLFEGAVEALGRVREQGLTTAVLSNGTAEGVGQLLRNLSIGQLFDYVLVADSVHCFKPAAAVYALAESAFRIPAAEIALVSGNDWDCAGARIHGMHALWTARGRVHVPFLGQAPDVIVDTIAEVPEGLARF